MDSSQAEGRNFFDAKEVGKVSTRVVGAEMAVAGSADGRGIGIVFLLIGNVETIEFRIGQVDLVDGGSAIDVKALVASVTGGKNAIEDMIAELDAADNFFGLANAEAVEKVVPGGVLGDAVRNFVIELAIFVQGPTSIAKAVKANFS